MIFIPPMEIATRIMTLIDSAKTDLTLVSPYISIDKWDKFKKCLQRAVDRDVKITIYVRENAVQNLDSIRSFNVNLILIKDLHAKIYINDSYAIATSQNLIQYSDSNSIDFGYSTETEEERNQLLSLINQYLVVSRPVKEIVNEISNVEMNLELEKESDLLFLENFDINKIYETFKERYGQKVIKDNNLTYVYCSELFEFGDVMFREGLEIRFKFQQKNCASIVKILESLDFKHNHYKYTKELKMSNGYHSSFIFVPQNVTDIQKLIYDYIFMVTKIKDMTMNMSRSGLY